MRRTFIALMCLLAVGTQAGCTPPIGSGQMEACKEMCAPAGVSAAYADKCMCFKVGDQPDPTVTPAPGP